jgi:Phosphodiester glycosidase
VYLARPGLAMSLRPLKVQPALRRAFRRERVALADGQATTVHLAEFDLARTFPRVVSTPSPMTLVRWCRENDAPDAIVGGFFTRPATEPLGELWIGGARQPSVDFDAPWGGLRSCVAVDAGEVRIATRREFPADPDGDLVQAGPLLVRGGQPVAGLDRDPEGFSSGSGQFDSDITAGRYPRSALGVTGSTLIAAVCDGRAADEAGLTLAELASVMAGAGSVRAINLDGGGSASLVLDGRLINRPREEHGVVIGGGRPVATAIAFS